MQARASTPWPIFVCARAWRSCRILLLFATAGGSWADASLPITGPGGASRDGTFFGWNVGGGAEVAFSQNWSARFDYQFTDFDSNSVSYPGGKTKYDPDLSTYRGSFIYHF